MPNALFCADLYGFSVVLTGTFVLNIASGAMWTSRGEKEKPRDLFNVTFGDGKSVFHICPRANLPIMLHKNDLCWCKRSNKGHIRHYSLNLQF